MRRSTLHHRHLMFSQPVDEPAGGGGQQPPAGGKGDKPATGGTGGQQAPPADDGKRFSQSELDRILAERVAAEQARWQKKVDDAAALAEKSGTERAELERDQAKKDAETAIKNAAKSVATANARASALTLGAKPERVKALIGQADLTAAIADDGTVDEAKVEAAIKKALEEYPEWKATAGSTTPASGAQHTGGGGSDKPTFTRAQIDGMSPDELQKNLDAINEALADGRVTG